MIFTETTNLSNRKGHLEHKEKQHSAALSLPSDIKVRHMPSCFPHISMQAHMDISTQLTCMWCTCALTAHKKVHAYNDSDSLDPIDKEEF